MFSKISKGILAVATLSLLAFFVYQGNFSFSFGQGKTLTVVGTGKVTMKPEVARFTAGVQKFSDSVSEAMKQENQTTKAIINALRGSGIKEEDIQTSYFSVWPQMSDYYEEGIRKNKISGYSVSNNVAVKIRDIDRVSDIIAKVIDAGANNISGVSFGADEPKEQESEARDKAVADAREKAQKMAQSSGRKLGKIISVSEGNVIQPVSSGYRMMDGAGGGGGPAIEAGSVEVAQTVTVVFELR